jgi:hypothetical protein
VQETARRKASAESKDEVGMCKGRIVKTARSAMLRYFPAILGLPVVLSAQVQSANDKTVPQQEQLPITTTIKKTVSFLETHCMHDYRIDAPQLTPQRLQAMTPQDRLVVLANLGAITAKLENVDQSVAKLTKEEQDQLAGSLRTFNRSDDASVISEIGVRLNALLKMTSLTTDEIGTIKAEAITNLPFDTVRGTGFYVGVVDKRIPLHPEDKGQPRAFTYLVTNRHVSQPGSERGNPCNIIQSFVIANHKADKEHAETYAQTLEVTKLLDWNYSTDGSVDLAVAPLDLRIRTTISR